MKKKNLIFCLFAVFVLTVLPVVSSSSTITELRTVQRTDVEKIISQVEEKPATAELTGYLLVHVNSWQLGSGFPGFQPYPGANVSARGFLYSYNGTTDENGDCLLRLHTNLIRAKMYFIKVSIFSNERLVTRRTSIFIEPRDIIYKEFLFIIF
jgi:hypothetical protein